MLSHKSSIPVAAIAWQPAERSFIKGFKHKNCPVIWLRQCHYSKVTTKPLAASLHIAYKDASMSSLFHRKSRSFLPYFLSLL